MADHLHGHDDAVAAEQYVRSERAAFVDVNAVDDERLAVANAVLLVADSDDRVVHSVEIAGHEPAKAAEV